MFIAADAMAYSLPKDVRALHVTSAVPQAKIDRGETHGGKVEESPAISMSGLTLDRWDVQSHQYTTKLAVEASILGRLFSSSAKVSSYGLVQEAKRFCIRTTETSRRVEYGTAVRLSVVVLATDFDASLTLPNIAAKAQLSDIHARIALSVDGYTGPLGELLPAPDNLNVENLAVYTAAFKAIQAQVFGAAGLNYNSPTLLGYDDQDEPVVNKP